MKKKIGLISLLMAGTAAVALTGCSNNDAQVKQNEDSISAVQKDVKTLKESLAAAQTSLEEYMSKINTYLEIEKVSTKGDVIASLKAQIAALEASSTKAVTDAVAALETKLTTLETSTKAALDAATGELIKDAEEKVVPIQTQINEINAGIAGLGDTYATDAELQAAIDAVNAAMGELDKEDDKVVPLQDQIRKINTNIDELDLALVLVDAELTNLGNADTELQSKITGVSDALTAYKTKVNDTYAKLADLAKLEDDLTTLITNTKTELETTINTNKTNAEQAIAEANATITTAKNDLTTLITNTKTTLEASIATKAVQADVTKAFADAAKDLADFEDEVAETYATIDALEKVEAKFEDYVTNETYTEAIAKLTEFIGEVEVDTDGKVVASLQAQIKTLTTAKATVEALDKLAGQFADDEKAFNAKIDNLQAQIGEIKTDEDTEEVISLQDQINDLQAQIGEIAKDDDKNIISLQKQINELRIQIGDLSSVSELKDLKADLTEALQMEYANFKDIIDEAKAELSTYTNVDQDEVAKLFAAISKSFSHEMQGYLAKGNAYILLAATAEEAEAAEEEYAIKIGNYINPALFQIAQQLNLAIIKSESLTKIGAYTDNTSLRYKYAKEVENQKWFTEGDIDGFTPEEYKAKTDELVAAMKLSSDKATAINAFLVKYDSGLTTLDTIFEDPTLFKDQDAKDTFIALLDDIKGDLSQYDNCKNLSVFDYDPFTGETSETKKMTDLEDQLDNDSELIDFALSEATAYAFLNSAVTSTYKTIAENCKNLTDEEKQTISKKLVDVIDIHNYAMLQVDTGNIGEDQKPIYRQRTEADLNAQLEKDAASVAEIKYQAEMYDKAVAYTKTVNKVIMTGDETTTPKTLPLEYLFKFNIGTVQEPVYAVDDLTDKISAVPVLADYLAAPEKAAPVDPEQPATEPVFTIDEVYAANRAAINLLAEQGAMFNETLRFAGDSIELILEAENYVSIKNKDKANETDEITTIIGRISEIADYDNFVKNAEYLANFESDMNEIQLVVDEASAYNGVLALAEENIALVKNLENIGQPKDEPDGTSEEEMIIAAINSIAKIGNYIGETADATETIGEGDAAKVIYGYQTAEEANSAAINLVYNQAVAYDGLLGLAKESVATVNALTNVSDENKKAIVKLINNVPVYDNYIGNDDYTEETVEDELVVTYAYKEQETNDTKKVVLITAQAEAYGEVLDAAADAIAAIKQLEFIEKPKAEPDGTSEQEKIIKAIEDIAVFKNFIGNDPTGEDGDITYETIKTQNIAAIELIESQAIAYNEVLGYTYERNINISETPKIAYYDYVQGELLPIIVNAGYISLAECKDINDLINAVPAYGNYIGNDDYEEVTVGEVTEKKYAYVTQIATDKDKVDEYVTDVYFYNDILEYINSTETGAKKEVSTILGISQQEASESAKIYELMNEVPVFGNYFGEEKTAIAKDQVITDKSKVDLLVTRAEVFKAIYDAINANDTQFQGLAAYIDGKPSGYTASQEKGQFTEALKKEFKKQFTDLAVAEKYDAVVAEFTKAEDFETYKNSILGTDTTLGILSIIKIRVDTFCDILNYVNTNEDYINNKTEFSQFVETYADYDQAFIDNFIELQDFDAFMDEVGEFSTAAAFETYYGTNVKTFIDNVVKVATYENKLIDNVNKVKTAILNAQLNGANPKIKANVGTYLGKVVNTIYAEFTTVTNGDTGYTTKTTIEDNAIDTPTAQLKAVKDAITTLYNVDIAAAQLKTNLGNYIETQRNDFLDKYYFYRDDEEFATDYGYEVGEFGGLNQAALEAWADAIEDINNKRTEVEYNYTTPTEFTYVGLTEFMDEIAIPQNILNRINVFVLWYSEDTDEHPEAGKVYEITAKYEELDAAKLDDARAYFLPKLEAVYNTYYAGITDTKTKGKLESNYKIYVNQINRTYAISTATIIDSYEKGLEKLADIYADAVDSYRDDRVGAFIVVYSQGKAEVSEFTIDQYEDAYDAGVKAMEAAKSEETIDAAYDAAVKALSDVIVLDAYKKTNKTSLEKLYNDDKALLKVEGKAAELFAAYDDGIDAINAAIDEDEVDDAYDAAEAAMALIVYKDGKITNLKALFDGYTTEVTEEAYYTDGVDAINAATDEDKVDAAYDDAAAEMFADFKDYKDDLLSALKGFYETFGETPAANITTEYNTGVTNINAATTKDGADTAFDNAVTEMAAKDLANYKASMQTALDNAYAGYGETPAENITAEYKTGVTNINAATTKDGAETACANAKAAMAAKDLANYKVSMQTALDNAYTGYGLTPAANITAVYTNAQTAIADATTKDDAQSACTTAITNMALLDLSNYKSEKDAALYALVPTVGVGETIAAYKDLYNTYSSAIADATTKDDVNTVYEDGVIEMNLLEDKKSYLSSLESMYGEFGTAPAQDVTTAYNTGKTAINGAKSLDSILTAYKTAMGSFLTCWFNVEYKGLNETKPDVYTTLSGIKSTAITNIENAESKAMVNKAYNDAKDDIVAKYSELTFNLDDYKDQVLDDLFHVYDNVYDQLVASYEDRLSTLNTIYGNGQTAINDASNKDDVDQAYNDYVDDMWKLVE